MAGDRDGSGKTTVTRALLDFLSLNEIEAKAFDTDKSMRNLSRFFPKVTTLIDLSSKSDLATVMDRQRKLVTVIDIHARGLIPALRSLDSIGFFDAVRAGEFGFITLHVLEPTSYQADVFAVKPFVENGLYFLVKNHKNKAAAFRWKCVNDAGVFETVARSGDIIIPEMRDIAYDQVEIAGTSYLSFIANETEKGEQADHSFVMRGYVRSWLARVADEFERVGLREAILGKASLDQSLIVPKPDEGTVISELIEEARRGDVTAMCTVALQYSTGHGKFRQDHYKAAWYFRLAADKGSSLALYHLALYFQQGLGGLPFDPKEAKRLLEMAAALGNIEAKSELQRRDYEAGDTHRDIMHKRIWICAHCEAQNDASAGHCAVCDTPKLGAHRLFSEGSIFLHNSDRAELSGRSDPVRSSYDPNNIFARILRGEIPIHRVFEDDVALAFMDIMPRAEGHVVVIPKEPARGLIDVEATTLARLVMRVQHVAKALQSAFKADGLTLHQFNESAGGQVIYHLHFHLLPRWDGVPLRAPSIMADNALLAEQAEKIRNVMRPFSEHLASNSTTVSPLP